MNDAHGSAAWEEVRARAAMIDDPAVQHALEAENIEEMYKALQSLRLSSSAYAFYARQALQRVPRYAAWWQVYMDS